MSLNNSSGSLSMDKELEFNAELIIKRASEQAKKLFKTGESNINPWCLLTCYPTQTLIAHYATTFDMPQRTYKVCLEMIEKLKECPIKNAHRIGLAAGIIYIARILEPPRHTQREIAEDFRISESLVRTWYRKIVRKLEIIDLILPTDEDGTWGRVLRTGGRPLRITRPMKRKKVMK